MNVDVQLHSTGQQQNDSWTVWQWWMSIIGTAAIASAIGISRRPDLPTGFWFVIISSACVFGCWERYLQRRGQVELRIILSKLFFITSMVPMLTLFIVGVLSDWYVPITTTLWYTLLLGGAVGAIVALLMRRYVGRIRSWFLVNVAIGICTVTAALFAHRAIATTADVLLANMVAGAVTALGWGIVPGMMLSRMLRTIPYETLQHIQERMHQPRYRFTKWQETWAVPVYLMLVLLSLAIPGLRTCGWLDTIVGRSGCVAQLEIEDGWPETVVWSKTAALIAANTLDSFQLVQLDTGQVVFDLPETIIGDNPFKYSVAPNGKLIAFTFIEDDGGYIQVWNSSGERLIEAPTTDDRSVAFSADSRFVVSGSTVWNMQTKAIEQQFPAEIRLHNFSLDGTLVAASQRTDKKHEVQVWNTATWTLATTMDGFTQSFHDLVFSPDNQYLAVSGHRDQIDLRRVVDGSDVWRRPIDLEAVDIEWSPDGSMLAAAGGHYDQGSVWVIRPADGSIQDTWTTANDRNDIVVWSPDGTRLVTNGRFGWVRTWRIN